MREDDNYTPAAHLPLEWSWEDIRNSAPTSFPVVRDLYSSAEWLVNDLERMVDDEKPLTRRLIDPLEALTSGERCCDFKAIELSLITHIFSIAVAVRDRRTRSSGQAVFRSRIYRKLENLAKR